MTCNAIHCNQPDCQCEPCVMSRVIARQAARLADYQKRMLAAHDLCGKWAHTGEAASSGLGVVLLELQRVLTGER